MSADIIRLADGSVIYQPWHMMVNPLYDYYMTWENRHDYEEGEDYG